MSLHVRSVLFIIFVGSASVCHGWNASDSTKSLNLSHWAFDILNIPEVQEPLESEIVVAVIDDGFRLTHNSIRDFLYTNNDEIPANGIDDDNNGYIDDYQGWDISDHDGDVQISERTAKAFYHGTFITSLITYISSKLQDEEGPGKIKILPVKALSDEAQATAILDGYRGIEYATQMGADIICCAWSGGNPTDEEIDIVSRALQDDILIIAATGNTNREHVDFPASIPGVLAIAALDTALAKTRDSNYGMRVDLALPGEKVRAAYPVADNAWFYGRGTSAAAGLATGCAALLRGLKGTAKAHEIIEAMKNTSLPLDSVNNSYCGKLGAGLPNLFNAVDYLMHPEKRPQYFDPRRPEGVLYINSKNKANHWTIQPWGAYTSITFIPGAIKKKDTNKRIQLCTEDSIYFAGTLGDLKGGVTIPGSKASLNLNSDKKNATPSNLQLNYFVETVDSTTLYCGGIVNIEADEGSIYDGSGEVNYANNCTCSWHIYAPHSDRISFSFTQFDTEPQVDFVWLFDGYDTQPENIIAKFSGSGIPPAIISRTNRVKIWFVTDQKRSGKGWHLQFKGLD